MEKVFVLASNNAHKVDELREKLQKYGIKLLSQKEAGIEIEPDETGDTFRENAIIKAEAVYQICHKPTIADDSGLEIDAIGGQPGVHSHRFAGPDATDDDRINKVLEMLKDTQDDKRTARFKTSICYIDEKGEKHFFDGVCEGKIGYEKKGTNGFGFDPVFIYEGRTFAQRTREEKSEVSHRGRAVSEFIKYIEKINKEEIR